MKRSLAAYVSVVALMGFFSAAPAFAGAERGALSYFSVSLVNPQTRALIPMKIFTNGRLTLDRKLRIPYGATFHIKLVAPRGYYISAVFRDGAAVQYDLPRRARYLARGEKQFLWTMPRRFVPGDVELFLSLYASMNQETGSMHEYTVERTGWIPLGETHL